MPGQCRTAGVDFGPLRALARERPHKALGRPHEHGNQRFIVLEQRLHRRGRQRSRIGEGDIVWIGPADLRPVFPGGPFGAVDVGAHRRAARVEPVVARQRLLRRLHARMNGHDVAGALAGCLVQLSEFLADHAAVAVGILAARLLLPRRALVEQRGHPLHQLRLPFDVGRLVAVARDAGGAELLERRAVGGVCHLHGVPFGEQLLVFVMQRQHLVGIVLHAADAPPEIGIAGAEPCRHLGERGCGGSLPRKLARHERLLDHRRLVRPRFRAKLP